MRRRAFLGAAAGLLAAPRARGAAAACPDPFRGARLLGTLPLSGLGGVDHPLGTLLGRGLDARLATDLSSLTPETLLTPTERFFVRSEAPAGLAARAPWTVRVGGLVREERALPLAEIAALAVPMGVHLIECAGNNNPANFGLISAASWAGVPLQTLLERTRPLPHATRVLVSGLDPAASPSRRSQPGASWVFSMEDVARWRPFLATHMNGAPLGEIHGAPLRLVVPRWYGCASIKWVDEVRLLGDDALATPHMKEFARRTHQDGIPERARDYRPACVDLAAMPVRVEKWSAAGALEYRVVGVVWGGERPADRLRIGFGDDAYAPLEVCPAPTTNDTWSLWSMRWRPPAPGRYKITLKAADPSVATRRLDLYYYIREVRVDEV